MRNPGWQKGRPAHNRGKMAPSFVKGSDGELRVRKPPGFKPGNVPWNKGSKGKSGNIPWNKGMSRQEQQEYRLQRGKPPNGAAIAGDPAVDSTGTRGK